VGGRPRSSGGAEGSEANYSAWTHKVPPDGLLWDDDESLKESVRDKVMKQSFTKMLERASSGQELLPIVDLLPNSSQKYGHSIAMNVIIKLIGRQSAFRDNCEFLYTFKAKKGQETRVPATYTSLSLSNKMLLKDMVKQLSPTHGPWHEVVQLLGHCDKAFDDSAAAIKHVGMPANHVACIAHKLCDEQVIACLIPLSVAVQSQGRPALLDHQRATGRSPSVAAYDDIFNHYKEWKKDYINPFQEGIFSEDLGAMKPHLASFKDGNAIKGYVKMAVAKVEMILKNHQQSGSHSSGDERLNGIKTSLLSPKGKNVEMCYFYLFLVMEEKDLKFASRQLEGGVRASAGFGTVGSGATATKKRTTSGCCSDGYTTTYSKN
jgi:hypothetical protein